MRRWQAQWGVFIAGDLALLAACRFAMHLGASAWDAGEAKGWLTLALAIFCFPWLRTDKDPPHDD